MPDPFFIVRGAACCRKPWIRFADEQSQQGAEKSIFREVFLSLD
jgi:hypothetical protein